MPTSRKRKSSSTKPKGESTNKPVAKRQASGVKPETYDLSAISAVENGFKIVTWNVNGLQSVLDKHNGVIAEYMQKEDPDVLCLQETKISPTKSETVTATLKKMFPGYTLNMNCCAIKNGYSGTLILSKVAPRNVKFGDITKEGRVIIAEYEHAYLICAYVPNSGLKLDRLEYRTKTWDPAFQKELLSLDAKKPVIWCGDLNVAHADSDVNDWKKKRNKVPGFCDAERENFGSIVGGDGNYITDTMRKKRTVALGMPGGKGKGFSDVWRHLYPEDEGYTFWSYRFAGRAKNNGWRLDYFVVSERLKKSVQSCERRNQLWGPSDHIPLVLVVEPGTVCSK